MLKPSARIFPIGFILSVDAPNFDPHDFYLDGNWERIKGKVIVGVDETQTEFNVTGKTGGAKTQQLTVANLPTMQFTTGHLSYSDSLWTGINITHVLEYGKGSSGTNDEGARNNTNGGPWHKYSWGSNSAHNNLQPYQTAYVWKLISYSN